MNTPQQTTQREAVRFALKAVADANLDLFLDRITEAIMREIPEEVLLDSLLKGVISDVKIVDEDRAKDFTIRTLGIEPCEYRSVSAKFVYHYRIQLTVTYQCGVNDNGIDPIYDHKTIQVDYENREKAGVDVFYV